MRFVSDQRLVFILLGIVWIEISLLPLFSIGQIKPDFFLVFIVFYAFRISWKRVVTLTFFVGLIRDLLTNSFFGLETASCVGGAILLQFLAMRFDREKRWIQLASLFAFAWFSLLLFAALDFLVQGHPHWNGRMFNQTFLIAAYTTGAGYVLLPLLEKLPRSIFRQKQYELF